MERRSRNTRQNNDAILIGFCWGRAITVYQYIFGDYWLHNFLKNGIF
jgi:hypothetical protein